MLFLFLSFLAEAVCSKKEFRLEQPDGFEIFLEFLKNSAAVCSSQNFRPKKLKDTEQRKQQILSRIGIHLTKVAGFAHYILLNKPNPALSFKKLDN